MKLFKFKRKKKLDTKKKNKGTDPYFEIGKLVREARIGRNLSINDLASISMIPVSTLIAIENNNKDLLPQYPFIRSILLKLEDCLQIEKFKLVELNNNQELPIKKKLRPNIIINKLDIINSWQGTLTYFLVIIVSLFILNSYYTKSRVIEFKYIEKDLIK